MIALPRAAARLQSRPRLLVVAVILGSSVAIGCMSAAVARDVGAMQFWLEESGARMPALRRTVDAVSPVLTIRAPIRTRARPVKLAARNTVHHRQAVARLGPRTVASPFVAGRMPAVVTIYDDATLRRGDAVMTEKGLRVFAGSSAFPFRPEDFTTLSSATSIGKVLRKALVDFDQDPVRRREG